MFTQSLIINMPYELFWHGEPSLYYNYLDAYEKKLKNEDEAFKHRENFKAWLNGLYMDIALSCNHPLAKSKRAYLNQPIDISGKEEVETMENNEDLTKKEEQIALAQFMAFGEFVKAFNKKRKENGE